MKFRRRGDVALAETIALALAVIVFGIFFVPPIVQAQMEFPKIQALQGAQTMGAAILSFQRDTSVFPQTGEHENSLQYLHGPGEIPRHEIWPEGKLSEAEIPLNSNRPEIPHWNGPYLQRVDRDPWGYALMADLQFFRREQEEKTWVLSPGPNGELETSASDRQLVGDDIGVLID